MSCMLCYNCGLYIVRYLSCRAFWKYSSVLYFWESMYTYIQRFFYICGIQINNKQTFAFLRERHSSNNMHTLLLLLIILLQLFLYSVLYFILQLLQ
ncbi:hypothetical protein GDO81_007843 [Engystomops pustulosus]|uniref:Uncharacterized protein n=1 Tax=Engystomops pustulosus TaxID=76066 RepID=A0AAV7CA72_ENGPU|nr:hypothetical protein GDO81_007843 [Engystomops pustulosus]